VLLNIFIAAVLIVATTVIHAGGMILAMRLMRSRDRHLKRLRRMRIYRVGGIVLLMFNVSLLEVLLWATTYHLLDALEGFEPAFYFSMVTFTTLGYGEIVLGEQWRLLASFEAANGIIMFGWTTAIILAAVQRIYFSEETKQGATSS